MSITPEEVRSWASAYIEAQQLQGQIESDNPLWWSIERFMSLTDQSRAEEAWLTILEILDRKPPDRVISILAAGPLEDLIEQWGAAFIDRIELQARADPAFRHLLGGVWRSSTQPIWERVEKARATSW